MGVEQRFLAVEGDDPANQPPKRVVRCRLDGRKHRTEEFRQVVRSQRELGHGAEAPPPPPFIAQNRSECVQALAILTAPSAVTISASRRLAAAIP